MKWKINRWTIPQAEIVREKFDELKKAKGEADAIASLRALFTPENIALFAYIVLPHYFDREFKDVHYRKFEHLQIGKRKKKNKASMMYRGGGKTSINVVLEVIYEICEEIFSYIVLNSYNKNMANDKLKLVKDEFESNDIIRFLYGEPVLKKEYWNKADIEVFGRSRIKTISTGENPRGLLDRGTRPDKVISDDILDDDAVRSQEQRDKAIEWYKKALMKVLAKGGVMEVLNTPLHPDDIIMTIFSGEVPFHNWDTLKIPVLDHNNESVDPDLHTTEELLEDQKDEYTFSQEMMCEPLRVNSGMIKYEDCRFYNQAPNPSDILEVFIHADTTHTAKQTSDYFTIGVLGQHKVTKKIYLLDYFIGKIEVNEQADKVIDFYQRFHDLFSVRKITYDEKANQGFGYWVKEKAREKGIFIPLEPLGYPKDKVTHFQPHVPLFKSNTICFPALHPQRKLLMDQLLAFPEKGVHDDVVDMLSGGLDNFLSSTTSFSSYR